MSHRHEQKHLLHNWSHCRYRDRPQSPRAVLRVRLAGGNCYKRTIFVAGAHGEKRQRIVVRPDKSMRVFLELEGLTDEPLRLCSVGQTGDFRLLSRSNDLLMFAAVKVFLV
jgi:hypothetical protein